MMSSQDTSECPSLTAGEMANDNTQRGLVDGRNGQGQSAPLKIPAVQQPQHPQAHDENTRAWAASVEDECEKLLQCGLYSLSTLP